MQTSFSVGECVEYGWNEFKQRPAAYVLTTFVLLVLYAGAQFTTAYLKGIGILLGFILGPLFWVCTLAVARKGASGTEPTLNDAFLPFTERQGDYLMVALAIVSGVVLCGVGAVITWFLFGFAPLYALEGRDFKSAVIASKDLVMKYPGEVAMLVLVLFALNLAGILACGIGTLVTTPISTLAFVKGYEQLTRSPILTAGGPEEPPVDPMPPAV
jgi:uncharacterized membrane protein